MTSPILVWALVAVQAFYLTSILVTLWFFLKPVNRVDRTAPLPADPPQIVLFYPVLNELEETMRTTFMSIARAPYPAGLVRVIGIPNSNDSGSVQALERLTTEFDFLEVMPVPPTTHPSWNAVWSSWDANPKAYWWHEGRRAGQRDLPPKKTRQLIWAMYQTAPDNRESLLSYIDADSAVPTDYWHTAAVGMESYDVVQNTNITGNPLATWPTAFYAMDHMSWDSSLYRHMTADGKHPFYVLGKGLFFRFSDLIELGGFHPWLTIEDPEVGMRLWTNGRRLGVVESPLVEEVPATWAQGVTQRKRWVAGFFQSLAQPLTSMGMRPLDRFKARLNFFPTLSLAFNPVGWIVGIIAIVAMIRSAGAAFPLWVAVLSAVTLLLAAVLIVARWLSSWTLLRDVMPSRARRLLYLLLVNPVFMLGYWLWWTVPIAIGFDMWRRDRGLVWERTEKRDANHRLVREDRSTTTVSEVTHREAA
ncbi:glycosyltransferase family 2 protein [Amnibacterium endophyticum]|uniref:Glycosyltransferase family 2 protein n=1 Tax=Amnibacterium endophyticum TaxID=2109337 RepID=A0ABW4LCN8_9MICO